TTRLTGMPMPAPAQTDLAPLMGLRGVAGALAQAINSGMQNTLINLFVYSTFRAIFEWITRTPIGRSRWTIAGKIRMSVDASDFVFVACMLVYTALTSFDNSASNLGRALNAGQAVAVALLALLVLL